MLLQLQVVFVKFRLYCIVQFSLILCFTGVQMYILTPTIKLALSDVVFLQDKSWRLRGCYCCCPTQKEKFCISS